MDDTERRRRYAEINEAARRAYLEGALEGWARAMGRPPTEEELRRVLARFPGHTFPLSPEVMAELQQETKRYLKKYRRALSCPPR